MIGIRHNKSFIVRPFGTKEGINFEEVQKTLIAPALAVCDVHGGTTEPFLQAGNIRTDMFQQLLVADLVVADISNHNANVFYELGIRHARQPKRILTGFPIIPGLWQSLSCNTRRSCYSSACLVFLALRSN